MSKYTVDLGEIQDYITHESVPNYNKCALLVIEMQETFRSDLGIISEDQIKNIKALTKHAETNGSKVIYVRHNDSSKGSQPMINWWGDELKYGSPNWQMIPEIDPKNNLIIDKNQYSAFFGTNLDDVLKQNGIEDVIITGVMTNCCCETAARDAFMRGYRVFFVNDATSTVNKELHIATLKNLAFGFAYIKDTKDLI